MGEQRVKSRQANEGGTPQMKREEKVRAAFYKDPFCL